MNLNLVKICIQTTDCHQLPFIHLLAFSHAQPSMKQIKIKVLIFQTFRMVLNMVLKFKGIEPLMLYN